MLFVSRSGETRRRVDSPRQTPKSGALRAVAGDHRRLVQRLNVADRTQARLVQARLGDFADAPDAADRLGRQQAPSPVAARRWKNLCGLSRSEANFARNLQ